MDYRIFNMCTDVNACNCTWGCTDTVRESALTVDYRRKICSHARESNLRWRSASPMLNQLSYIPTLSVFLGWGSLDLTPATLSQPAELHPHPVRIFRMRKFRSNPCNTVSAKWRCSLCVFVPFVDQTLLFKQIFQMSAEHAFQNCAESILSITLPYWRCHPGLTTVLFFLLALQNVLSISFRKFKTIELGTSTWLPRLLTSHFLFIHYTGSQGRKKGFQTHITKL